MMHIKGRLINCQQGEVSNTNYSPPSCIHAPQVVITGPSRIGQHSAVVCTAAGETANADDLDPPLYQRRASGTQASSTSYRRSVSTVALTVSRKFAFHIRLFPDVYP